MSENCLSDEMRLDMVMLFYANGSSATANRRAVWKKYGEAGRKINLNTIRWQVTKFETEDGSKTRQKVTVWMGLSYHGIFGPHFFENEE